jgi:hypothetical protein
MSTTSAYGWNIPDNTDLVKDGALAIRTLGNAIDTSMNTALGTKKAGMVLLNTTSFSGVASQNFTSIFSSSYTNYKILLTNLTGANQVIRGRFGTSGTPNSASSYFYGGFTMTTGGTSGAASGNSQTSIFLTYAASDPSSILIDIFQPNTAVRTEFNYFGYDGYNNRMHIGSGAFTNTTSFTDFQIFPDSSNISGTASIYGYNA